MSKRKSRNAKERARLFKLHGGKCHLCGGQIDGTREAWEISHDIPLELGGADDDTNALLAHKKCHRDHTAKVDIPTIAKAKRREAKHTGAAVPKQSIPQRPKFKREGKTPLRPRELFRKAS
jgi:5-methylcytosine-specific restriction endonuclease McrA